MSAQEMCLTLLAGRLGHVTCRNAQNVEPLYPQATRFHHSWQYDPGMISTRLYHEPSGSLWSQISP